MKKLLCFIILAVFLLNSSVFAYNKDLCLEYAAFHFDDGKGLCAEFVADCLRAGGLNISANECNDLFDELTQTFGYPSYPLEVDADGRISLNKNAVCLSVGDLIIQECHNCKTFFHVVICGGEYNGYVTYYAHNAAHGNTKNDVFYNVPNYQHKGHTSIAYSIHFTDAKELKEDLNLEYKLCTVTASGGLNLRKTASTQGDVITVIEKNSVLTVFPALSKEGWAYTKTGSLDGFVKSDYLKETVFHNKTDVSITVGDKALASTPVIIEGRSLLPVRDIFEALGGEVSWSEELKTAKILIDGKTVTLKHLDSFMFVDGEQKDVLVPSVIIDGRMYVGARGVSEGLNKTVLWENNAITIN